MGLVGARPLEPAELIEPPVRHARVHRREPAAFIPDLLRGRPAPTAAQPLCQLADDVDVIPRARRRFKGAANPLHAAFAVGHRALGFSPTCGRGQDDVRQLRGLGEKDVLDDEVVEAAEQAHRARLVSLAACRILADDVDRAQVTTVHRLEHLAQVPAFLAREVGAAPRARELFVDRRILEVLETGQPGRDGAHVATTLDVVLAAQRVQAAAVPAHLAREQSQVDERKHVVDGVVMLRDAQGPADHASLRSRVVEGHLADRRRRHPGLSLCALERVGLDAALEFLVTGGGARDELLVGETGVDDLACHGVGQGDVAAHVDAEPHIGPFRGAGAARVDRDQAGAIADAA